MCFMEKTAIITGIYGQDGMYLCSLLLSKGYRVIGLSRPQSLSKLNQKVMGGLDLSRLSVLSADTNNEDVIAGIMEKYRPDEIYHLAADVTVDSGPMDASNLIIRNISLLGTLLKNLVKFCPHAKFFYAGSCLMFGQSRDFPQSERTRFNPDTPYGISKVAGLELVRYYRASHGIRAYSGILFNHESPIQKPHFLLRTLSLGIRGILDGKVRQITIRDLKAESDWTFAGDIALAIWSVMQSSLATDYVIGSGVSYTVRDIVQHAFSAVGLNWEEHVVTTKSRKSTELVRRYRADITNIRTNIGWRPRYTALELIEMMIDQEGRVGC